jgi:hypothetical protein
MIITEPVTMKIVVGPMQTGSEQNRLPVYTLVLKIVNGVHHTLVVHPDAVIDLPKQNRDEGGLPIMAVDDGWALTRFQQELDCGPAKECKAHRIIVGSVKNPTIKEIIVRMGLNEVAPTPMNHAEENGTVYGAPVPRNPKIVERAVKPPNLLIPQTIVFGQYDLDVVSSNLKLAAQAKNNIRQPAHFGDGR